jgi:hypothetical protein
MHARSADAKYRMRFMWVFPACPDPFAHVQIDLAGPSEVRALAIAPRCVKNGDAQTSCPLRRVAQAMLPSWLTISRKLQSWNFLLASRP